MAILCYLLYAYWFVLILHVVFSFVPRPPEPLRPVVRGVAALVEPLAAPLRRVLPPLRTGTVAFDLSILVLFLIVLVLQSALCS